MRILATYFKTCKLSEPNLNDCWYNAAKSVVPYLLKGVPELGIPNMLPLKMPTLTVKHDKFAMDLIRCRFYGLETIDIQAVKYVIQKFAMFF